MNQVLDGALDPPREGPLLGIIYTRALDPPREGPLLGIIYTRHPLGNKHVQSLRRPDTTNFVQQGKAMRPRASITVATC